MYSLLVTVLLLASAANSRGQGAMGGGVGKDEGCMSVCQLVCDKWDRLHLSLIPYTGYSVQNPIWPSWSVFVSPHRCTSAHHKLHMYTT